MWRYFSDKRSVLMFLTKLAILPGFHSRRLITCMCWLLQGLDQRLRICRGSELADLVCRRGGIPREAVLGHRGIEVCSLHFPVNHDHTKHTFSIQFNHFVSYMYFFLLQNKLFYNTYEVRTLYTRSRARMHAHTHTHYPDRKKIYQ